MIREAAVFCRKKIRLRGIKIRPETKNGFTFQLESVNLIMNIIFNIGDTWEEADEY
jgi:hypothetical protein